MGGQCIVDEGTACAHSEHRSCGSEGSDTSDGADDVVDSGDHLCLFGCGSTASDLGAVDKLRDLRGLRSRDTCTDTSHDACGDRRLGRTCDALDQRLFGRDPPLLYVILTLAGEDVGAPGVAGDVHAGQGDDGAGAVRSGVGTVGPYFQRCGDHGDDRTHLHGRYLPSPGQRPDGIAVHVQHHSLPAVCGLHVHGHGETVISRVVVDDHGLGVVEGVDTCDRLTGYLWDIESPPEIRIS